MRPTEVEITRLLRGVESHDAGAMEQLVELLRDELHAVAQRLMARQSPGHTLQATAVVNEAYLKLAAGEHLAATSRAHFLALAARSMRQILARHAHDRDALKRGGAWQRVSFCEDLERHAETESANLALHAALERLSKRDEVQARIVEMRFFGGMTVGEVATVLDLSASTVEREWRMARAWMRAELSGETAP